MSATPNRQAVIVGLLSTVAIAILAGGILTIGDLNDTFTRKVGVSAVFAGVNGLQQGDNIWFSGLKVGIVSKLGFRGDSQVQVDMEIDRSAMQFIHGDVLAKVGSDGLIGSRIVVLYGGTAAAPNLADGDEIGVGASVSSEEIMTTLQENNTNLLAITTDLREISRRIERGEGTVGKLLADDALYGRVTDTVSTLSAASMNARTLTASVSSFATKLNRAGGLPNDLVTDRTTYASLTSTVKRLNQTGESAGQLVDGLARGAADPATPVGTLLHDDAAGTDLKETLDNANRSSVLLAEDLEAAQHNFLLRGFFKKRERERAKADGEVAGK